MKNILMLALISLLFVASCDDSDDDGSVPVCIVQKTVEFSLHTCPEDVSVKEYNFQKKRVFVFFGENCGDDNNSSVLNEACDTLGYLGGFVGNRKINGVNFDDNAEFVRTIWEP
ncbi:MAG: hypothetical protein ABJC12_10590 [Saprospiraceae bacterium]